MTDERKAYYWLHTSGLSLRRRHALLEIYGAPSEIMADLGSEKLREFCGGAYDEMLRRADENVLNEELYGLRRKGLRLLVTGHPGYPEKLAACEEYPPHVLYCKGNTELLGRPTLAVVGSRASTDYGRRVAGEWAAELSGTFVIVSGHATGIDTYALRGALDAGGSVICVLACGHDRFDMPEFLSAAGDRALVMSAYPPGFVANKFVYHERNRLLSGISDGVLIVEAGEKSGALITATAAAEQGKPLFAVPGSVNSTRSAGTNGLLRNGATAATRPGDVLEDMGYERGSAAEEPILTGERATVAELLREGDKHFDDIAAKLGKSAGETAELLGEMEMEGIVERKMMNNYSLLVR